MLYKPAASVRAQYNKEIFFDFSFGTYGLIINPYVPKEKSKNISFPWYSKFLFLYWDNRIAQDLDQAKTSAMNSQICLFWSMKINALKR